ncbi:MAG: cyclic nucleotide-binding domain-containing protein [Myxococcales bacterium]|nr:cyclic nucleotide-binding domain-containing protein [Myxococcales bacterium]MCB9642518.1 cyclic nucleotide-binding domain-containing protein [Myxococcales bacterium]
MNLREHLLALLKEPTSVRLRLELAKVLLKDGWLRAASDMILASVRASVRSGDFFSGLAMTRLYLTGDRQREALELLADRFCGRVEREGTPLPQSPIPTRRRHILQEPAIRLPSERYDLIRMAYVTGVDISMVPSLSTHETHDIPIFHELKREDFIAFSTYIEPLTLEAGDELIRQGEREQAFYLLSHGMAIVEQERADGQVIELATVEAPTYVGEMSLLTHVPHRATVYVTCESIAWRISSTQLAFLSEKHPQILEHLQEIIRKRYLENLLKVGLSEFTADLHQSIYQLFHVRVVQPGETLFREGDKPPGLFVVLHGEARVNRSEKESSYRDVGILGEGDIFGEYSLLTSLPTRISVEMPSGGLLLHLPVGEYAALREKIPDLERALQQLLAHRLGYLPELIDPLPDFAGQRESGWILPNHSDSEPRAEKPR